MGTIATSFLTSLALLMHDKVLKGRPVRQDSLRRPFNDLLMARKRSEGIAQDTLGVTLLKESGLTLQTWRDKDTLNHGSQNTGMLINFPYMNGFMGLELVHDQWKKKGFTIIPNDDGTPESRINDMTGDELRRIKGLLGVELEQMYDRYDQQIDQKWHRAAATANDIDGLNGLFPINPYAGNFGTLARATTPILRHSVRTGATVTAGGTFEDTLEELWKETHQYCHAKGIPGGVTHILAGWDWIQGYRKFARNNGIQLNAPVGGIRKVDIGIVEFEYKGVPIIHDPTLDLMDSVAAAEQGLPYASGVTVSFSGGAGSGAAAVAYVTAGGALAGFGITNPGSGYTSAPTVTVSGTGTATATVYSASSGAGLVQVAADDDRIGQIAAVSVNAAGSGYTVPSVVSFSKRAYLINKDSWEFICQPKLDKKVSMPSDPITQRVSYIQIDGTYFLVNRAPRANAIHAIA